MDLKFKAIILTSMIVLTGVLGVNAYTASAYGYTDSEVDDDSSYSFMYRHRLHFGGPQWLDELTEEQREDIEQILQEMREQTQARITEKFQEWGIEAPEFEGCLQLMQFSHHVGW